MANNFNWKRGGRSEISLLSYPGKGLGVGCQLHAERHSSSLLLNFTSNLTHASLRGENTRGRNNITEVWSGAPADDGWAWGKNLMTSKSALREECIFSLLLQCSEVGYVLTIEGGDVRFVGSALLLCSLFRRIKSATKFGCRSSWNKPGAPTVHEVKASCNSIYIQNLSSH